MTDTCSKCGSTENVQRVAHLLPPMYDPTPLGERRMKSIFDDDWPDDVEYINLCAECLKGKEEPGMTPEEQTVELLLAEMQKIWRQMDTLNHKMRAVEFTNESARRLVEQANLIVDEATVLRVAIMIQNRKKGTP